MVRPRENIISSGGLRKSSIPKQSLLGALLTTLQKGIWLHRSPMDTVICLSVVFSNFRCMTCF